MFLLMVVLLCVTSLVETLRFPKVSTKYARLGASWTRLRAGEKKNVASDGNEIVYHVPVLLNECCEYLAIKPGGVYVDCTLGGGGHTKEILRRGGHVIGLDQDPDSIAKTSKELKDYIDSKKLQIIKTNFRYVSDAVKSSELTPDGLVDGVLMDLGISSHQIDEPSRGFAFGADGPLDMRMGQGLTEGTSGLTAAKIVNEWDATAIADLLYNFGEETRSRQIAREIVASRPINTTGELEKLISGMTFWKHRSKTLARCFQALRIAVNDEMGALDDALMTVSDCVRPGGRLVIISYHSLEDRRVKRLLKSGSVYENEELGVLPWIPLLKRAQAPTEEEIERNRRARSAKLRIAERADSKGNPVSDALKQTSKYGSQGKGKKLLGAKELARLARRREEEEEEDE
jgi:16S rRNA (cytosine1402-N4)-methyltransferase